MSTTTITQAAPLQQTAPKKGKLRYVAAGHMPQASPHLFHLPEASEIQDERLLTLHDMRPIPTVKELPASANHAQLETHGFTAVHHPTTLNAAPYNSLSWRDPDLLEKYYLPETADMLRQITGCKYVVADGLVLRAAKGSDDDTVAIQVQRSNEGDQGGNGPEPASKRSQLDLVTGFPQFIGFDPTQGGGKPSAKVHLDYTPSGARTHLRKFHPKFTEAAADIIKAEDALLAEGKDLKTNYKESNGPRWAIYSIWRPLKTVRRDALAVSDQRAVQLDDYVPTVMKFPYLGQPGVTGTHDIDSYLSRYSESHKWFWVEEQKAEEVVIITFFDSDAEKDGGPASGGILHSSVELPGTEDQELRESVELRCLCIW
jgi:hypothetical protein